jgi:hypothetical protein
MATRYVQDVSEQTDGVIENSRKYVLPEDKIPHFWNQAYSVLYA